MSATASWGSDWKWGRFPEFCLVSGESLNMFLTDREEHQGQTRLTPTCSPRCTQGEPPAAGGGGTCTEPVRSHRPCRISSEDRFPPPSDCTLLTHREFSKRRHNHYRRWKSFPVNNFNRDQHITFHGVYFLFQILTLSPVKAHLGGPAGLKESPRNKAWGIICLKSGCLTTGKTSLGSVTMWAKMKVERPERIWGQQHS